jgi:hypothetical protein
MAAAVDRKLAQDKGPDDGKLIGIAVNDDE